MVLDLRCYPKELAMEPLLNRPWQHWRQLLIDVLQFLDYEGAVRQIEALRGYIAEAIFTYRMSPDSALMAACLLNSPSLVTSIVRQFPDFLWAPVEGKDGPGWAHRALFVVSGAPKEFAEALPFQYYQALNYANRFAHPAGCPAKFCDEFWEALLRFWPDAEPVPTTSTAAGSDPRTGGTVRMSANDPATKHHRYPKTIGGQPVREGPKALLGSLAYLNTPDGWVVKSTDVEFRERVPQHVMGRSTRQASTSSEGGVQPVPKQTQIREKDDADQQPSDEGPGIDMRSEGEEEVDELDESSAEAEKETGESEEGEDDGNSDNDEDGDYEDEKSGGKRKRAAKAPTVRRSGRIQSKSRNVSTAPSEATPAPPTRGGKASAKASTSKAAAGRKRKVAESEQPEERSASPPKQQKKNPPKTRAAPKKGKK